MVLFISQIFSFHWKDAIDVLIVAWLIFEIYNLIRGTNALNVTIGIIAVYLIWKLVDAFELNLLSEFLGQFISVGVIALIIVFQSEIRKFLLLLGSPKFIEKGVGPKRFLFWRFSGQRKLVLNSEELITAIIGMSKSQTGALIALTVQNDLRDVIRTGSQMDCAISSELVKTIFFKNSPLHDGGMVISDNRIVAARCIFPLSGKTDLPGELGTRHRAALGMSESSDAIVIVVSEQTGKISLAVQGELLTGIDTESLFNIFSGQTKILS